MGAGYAGLALCNTQQGYSPQGEDIPCTFFYSRETTRPIQPPDISQTLRAFPLLLGEKADCEADVRLRASVNPFSILVLALRASAPLCASALIFISATPACHSSFVIFSTPSLKRQFRNPRLIQFTQPCLDHAVVLFRGGGGEGEIQVLRLGELEGDAGIFGGVRGGKKAGVVAVLHVLAVGLEHAGTRAGLREDFAEHGEVQAQGVAQAEAFGQGGGVGVHDHVDEGFDLCGAAGGADVSRCGPEFLEDGQGAVEGGAFAAAHEVQRALPRLGYAGGHAGFEGLRALGLAFLLDPNVGGGCDGGAVDEEFAPGAGEQAAGVNALHGAVVGDDGDDDVGSRGEGFEVGGGGAGEFAGQLVGGGRVGVEDGGDGEAAVLEPACHFRAHAADADEGNFVRSSHGKQYAE